MTLRVSAAIPGTDVELGADARQRHDGNGNGDGDGDGDAPSHERPTRAATLNGERVQLRVIGGAPAPGTTICRPGRRRAGRVDAAGPARLGGEVDQTGTIHLHRMRKAGDGSG